MELASSHFFKFKSSVHLKEWARGKRGFPQEKRDLSLTHNYEPEKTEAKEELMSLLKTSRPWIRFFFFEKHCPGKDFSC